MRIKHLRLAAAISETDHVTAMSRFNRSEPTAETVSPAEAPERRSRTRAELTALTYIRTPDLESKTMRFSHRRPPALLESTMSASSVASSMRLETPSPSPSPSHKRDVVDGRKFAEGMPLSQTRPRKCRSGCCCRSSFMAAISYYVVLSDVVGLEMMGGNGRGRGRRSAHSPRS